MRRARTAEVDALLASVDDEEARAWDAWLAGRLADLRAHAAKRAGSAKLALALTEQGLARAPDNSRLAVLQQELLVDLGRRTRAEVEAALGARIGTPTRCRGQDRPKLQADGSTVDHAR